MFVILNTETRRHREKYFSKKRTKKLRAFMSLCSNFIISLPTLKKRMPMLSRNILLLVLFLASLLPACKEKDVMPAELQEINEMLEGKPGNPY